MISLEQLQWLLVLWSIVSGLLTAAAAAGGAYAAMRVRLRNLDRRCDELRDDTARAHARIDRLVSTP